MAKDVLITPANGIIEFRTADVTKAQIQLDSANNLVISANDGDVSIITSGSGTDLYVGDGVNETDIVFEQNGGIYGLAGKTLSLGLANSYLSLAANITSGANITGNVTSSGNISGNYLLGNAFFATGITANKIYNGTTEVAIGSSGGPANISVGGTSNVVVVSSTGVAITGNLSVSGNATLSGNILGDRLQNGTTSIDIQTASGNANISVAGTSNVVVFSSSGQNVAGYITSTGNITGNYLLGNAFFATGITANKIYNGTTEVAIGSLGGNANISVGGTSNVVVFTTAGLNVTGVVSATGNVTGGNLITGDNSTIYGGYTTLNNQGVFQEQGVGPRAIGLNIASGYGIGFRSAGGATDQYIYSSNSISFVTGATLASKASPSFGASSNTGVTITQGGFLSVVGNIITGNLSASGNVTGRYFLGNANVQYTAATAPVSGNLIGAQWYNTSTDVLYEYQTDGTSTYWVDITGPIIGSNGAAGGTTLTNGTSNVSVALNGNTNVSIAGTPNVFVVASGGINTTGAVYSNFNTNTANTGSFNATGGNTKGGTGYLDFLVAQNTSGGATNPYKWLRLNTTGGLEIINSAYTATLLTLTDAGALSVASTVSGTGFNVNNKQAVNGPAFSAYASSGTTIPTDVLTKVNFQTEEYDTNSNFASSRFTPTVEGYYQLNSTVRISGSSGTGEMMIVLYKNGAEYKRGWNSQGVQIGSGWWSMSVSSTAYATGTGDYFEIYVQQGSAANRDTTSGTTITWFNGCMLRGA
jgi:hypothetical protein